MPFGWFSKSARGDKEILHLVKSSSVIMAMMVVVPMMMMAVVMAMMIDDDGGDDDEQRGRSWQPFGEGKNGHKTFVRHVFASICGKSQICKFNSG